MNKPTLIILASVSLLAMGILVFQSDHLGLGNQQDVANNAKTPETGERPDLDHHESHAHPNDEHGQAKQHHGHSHSDADFDFTPYVSKEMADEIRPYTSRSTKGLEVKMDEDGHEYVDLKKRWSHATISVIDENGVKHTGEWAPK
jgi:ABC-type Zn2+ transport system substrate-binding protein/surface adhesin